MFRGPSRDPNRTRQRQLILTALSLLTCTSLYSSLYSTFAYLTLTVPPSSRRRETQNLEARRVYNGKNGARVFKYEICDGDSQVEMRRDSNARSRRSTSRSSRKSDHPYSIRLMLINYRQTCANCVDFNSYVGCLSI